MRKLWGKVVGVPPFRRPWRVRLHCLLRRHRYGVAYSSGTAKAVKTAFCWDCNFTFRPVPTPGETREHFERERAWSERINGIMDE